MLLGMRGWDVFSRVKKMWHATKVVFVSALKVSAERKNKLINEGLADYITKPFDIDDLLKRVKNIVGE
jgi:DNA-binding response OmpR family regulator